LSPIGIAAPRRLERTGAAADPARRILVDLAAQARQPLSRWMADSRLLEASGQRACAEWLGAKTMPLQRLADATMQKIDGSSRSFWATMNDAAGADGSLGLLEQQRLWVWIKRAYEEIDRIGP
jgi:hypothetical protein